MQIIAYVRFYPPYSNCGADICLHSVLKFFQSRGHQVTVVLGEEAKGVPYVHEGIRVVKKPYFGIPYFLDCDVVFTQLDFTATCLNEIRNKPVVWFMHNTHMYGSVRRAKDRCLVVYNSESAQQVIDYPNRRFVLPPVVDLDFYNVCEGGGNPDGCVTLINLNENKGVELFYKLAELNPDLWFLGVKGSYGVQVVKELPNVEIWGTQTDMRAVYERTGILIMPSLSESWGRTATEASANGIPVICTDTHGLMENMGDAGIYLDRNDVQKWSDMIKKLKGKKEYRDQSAAVKKRSMDHNPKEKLEQFEEEVHKVARKPFKKQEYNGNG